MGKINFVRRFVPVFIVMVNPTHNMLKQDQSFSWNEDVEKTFVGIKKEMSFAFVLEKLDFEK